jgi:hypothetical protein
MICIIIFIIFLIFFPIFGFFPEYRKFFKKAWSCVWKRVTFRPCDVALEEEIKGKIFGKLVYKYPKFVKFVDKTFGIWAILFVIFNIWTLVYVANTGINLLVYDTCNPTSEEGCSLSGDSCEIGISSLTFADARTQGKILEWAVQPATRFFDTASRVPNRLKQWKAEDYLGPKPTFYAQREGNPVAVELIDPGCPSCKQLWNNIKQTNFTDRYNLSYNLYSIPSQSTENGYRFKNSKLLARYIETVKNFPLASNAQGVPEDWQFIDKLFTKRDEDFDIQFKFSYVWETESPEAVAKINEILTEIGYNDIEISQIIERSQSDEIIQRLDAQKDIVENKVQTIKIPTIIFEGRRYDRVLEVDKLK